MHNFWENFSHEILVTHKSKVTYLQKQLHIIISEDVSIWNFCLSLVTLRMICKICSSSNYLSTQLTVHLLSFAVFLHVSPTLIGDTTAACVMPPTFGSFTGRPASTLSRWYFYTMGPMTL